MVGSCKISTLKLIPRYGMGMPGDKLSHDINRLLTKWMIEQRALLFTVINDHSYDPLLLVLQDYTTEYMYRYISLCTESLLIKYDRIVNTCILILFQMCLAAWTSYYCIQ